MPRRVEVLLPPQQRWRGGLVHLYVGGLLLEPLEKLHTRQLIYTRVPHYYIDLITSKSALHEYKLRLINSWLLLDLHKNFVSAASKITDNLYFKQLFIVPNFPRAMWSKTSFFDIFFFHIYNSKVLFKLLSFFENFQMK